MNEKEIRAFPVPAIVILRSALFGLASMRAVIETSAYQEQNGTLIAVVEDKWLKIGPIRAGKVEHKVSIKVTSNGGTSVLEIDAPIELCAKLMQAIAKYAIEGSQAITKDATDLWSTFLADLELQRKKSENQEKRRELFNKLSSPVTKLFGKDNSEDEDNTDSHDKKESLALVSHDSKTITMIEPTITESLDLKIPPNPGMLIRADKGTIFELKPDPDTFADRTAFLQTCEFDHAVNIRGSKFCPNCGKPLTIGVAYKKEIRDKTLVAANAAIRFGVIGFIPDLLLLVIILSPLLIDLFPPLVIPIGMFAAFAQGLSLPTTAIGTLGILLLVSIPSMALGQRAINESHDAKQLLSLSFNFEKTGLGRASFGQTLGWIDTILGLGLFGFAVLALIAKIKGA